MTKQHRSIRSNRYSMTKQHFTNKLIWKIQLTQRIQILI